MRGSSPTRELMAVSVTATNGFRAGTPVRLFQTTVATVDLRDH